MKKVCLLILLSIIASISFAQNEANIWYFGRNAGLDFSGGAPVPLIDGELSTGEGCASIADPVTGNLIMYTDGITVWNRAHNPMPGSIVTPLMGNASSTMSAVIVPKPGSSNLYYIFTTPAQIGYVSPFVNTTTSMRYSIIDLNLDNGFGDIVSPNIPLVDSAVEKIAVMSNCSRSDYWIVGHKWNCDSFYAFKLTSAGLAPPVKTAIGLVPQNQGSFTNQEASLGYMKFSPNGRKLGLVVGAPVNGLEIFDFDFLTGVISNPITEIFFPNPANSQPRVYGCSFSPDNSKFYVSTENILATTGIYQYDMNAGNATAILASKTLIVESQLTSFGALQNAPDGKMYVSKNFPSGLGVINNPNAPGLACNYTSSGLNLLPGHATYGLPCIVESFLSGNAPLPPFNKPDKLAICNKDTIWTNQEMAEYYNISPDNSVLIDAENGKIAFFPTATTTYTITTTDDCNWGDTLLFTIHIVQGPTANFSFNPTYPTTENDIIYLQNESVNAQAYEWRNSLGNLVSQQVNFPLPNPGEGEYCYTLVAIDSLQCKDTAEKCVSIIEVIPSKVFAPTAFSPNGDGSNDIFKLDAINIKLERFDIYNRYGERVFHTSSVDNGWDGSFNGKPCDVGIYFYLIKYTDYHDEKKQLQNDVQLIR